METIICNLTGRTIRRMLHGREHIVAPVTMIVPGVLNGSSGPLYYSAEENAKRVDAWNGVPLTVYHPTEGKSARTPEIMDSQAVGVVLNVKVENGILKGEAWFDIERTRNVDLRVLNSLNSNEPIELSTGLKLDAKPVENGDFQGVSYTHLATNYQPDHLAVLPDQKGACSLQDGCGVLINEESNGKDSSSSSVSPTTPKRKGTGMDREKVIAGIIKNCDCWSEDDREVLNNFDDEKLKVISTGQAKAIANARLVDKLQKGLELEEGQLTLNSEGEFSFTVKEAPEEKEGEKEGTTMNSAGVGMAEQPKSFDEYMASAPPEVREILNQAKEVQTEAKKAEVMKLVANLEDDQKDIVGNKLMEKSLSELKMLSSLIPEKKETPVQNTTPKFNFSGASVPAFTANTEGAQTDEPMPVVDWDWN